MDNSNIMTPQKTKTTLWVQLHKSSGKKNKQKSSNLLLPCTPRSATSSMALVSLVGKSTGTVHTPPAKRFQKVRNPFEAALVDRLHLPVIASPSLFQCPTTPQLSSTQFEWTIDEVSQLLPAQVEPHETQFHDSPDPELETKAQSAISSFFKEHQIVPSPANCPLRNQRINILEVDSNTPISKPGRRIRDCESQTELTLPPILPPELEEALRPYFKPQLAGIGCEYKQAALVDMANTSMRRKLFDMHNIIVIDANDSNKAKPHNMMESSLSSNINMPQTTIAGKLSDSLDKSSFDSLSPISNLVWISPNSAERSATKRKLRQPNFDDGDMLSPITPIINGSRSRVQLSKLHFHNDVNTSEHATLAEWNDQQQNNTAKDNFTPERSSSPIRVTELSTDSFTQRVSRLQVNSVHHKSKSEAVMAIVTVHNDITELMYDDADDDDMQVSQHSFNCSSNSDTPRSKRRSANRKNLSQSFNATWLDEQIDDDTPGEPPTVNILAACARPIKLALTKSNEAVTTINNTGALNTFTEQRATFYRTDSGFNETSSTLTFTLSQEQIHTATAAVASFGVGASGDGDDDGRDNAGGVVVTCSTPSRHISTIF